MVDYIELERVGERINEVIEEIYIIAGNRCDSNWMADSNINTRVGWLKGLSWSKEDLLPGWFGLS